jgi:hypothetical protein
MLQYNFNTMEFCFSKPELCKKKNSNPGCKGGAKNPMHQERFSQPVKTCMQEGYFIGNFSKTGLRTTTSEP